MAAPNVGAIIDGYKFLGGNPNDEGAWQPVGVEELAAAKALGSAQGKNGLAGPQRVDQVTFNDAATQLKDLRDLEGRVNPLTSGFLGSLQADTPDPVGKGSLWNGIKGSPGYNLDSDLETIKARMLMSGLSKIKNPVTGGNPLGQMSNVEGNTLKAMVANLGVGQAPGQLRKNLNRVREEVIRNQRGVAQDNPYDLKNGGSRETIPRGAFYLDPQGNLRVNMNGDKGNPILKAAKAQAAPAASGGFKYLGTEN